MTRFSLLLGIALIASGCATTLVPTEVDRDAAITREDFSAWLDPLGLKTKSETLEKFGTAGIYYLEYKYVGASADVDSYIGSSVYVTNNQREASLAYRNLGRGAKLGIRPLKIEPASVTIEWPEEAEHYLLKREGTLVGNMILARRGHIAVLVVMSGTYVDPAQLFETQLAPHFERLSEYNPTPE